MRDANQVSAARAQGYRLGQRYLDAGLVDAWDVVRSEWDVVAWSDERMQMAVEQVPGLEYNPHHPLELAARLLVAFGDFLVAEENHGRDTLWRFYQRAKVTYSDWEASLDDDDEDDD